MYLLQQFNRCTECNQIHCTLPSNNAVIQVPERERSFWYRVIKENRVDSNANACHICFINNVEFGETPYSRPTDNRCMDCGVYLNLPHVSPRHPRSYLFCRECVMPYMKDPLRVKCVRNNADYVEPMTPHVTLKIDGIRGQIVVKDWIVTIKSVWDSQVIAITLGKCEIPDQIIDVEVAVDSDDCLIYYIHATATNPEMNCYHEHLVNTFNEIQMKPIVPVNQALKLLQDHSHLPVDGLIYLDSIIAKWKPHRTVDVYLDNPRAYNSVFIKYDVKISSTNSKPCHPNVTFYVIGTIVLPRSQIISRLHFHELKYTAENNPDEQFSYIRIRYDRVNPNSLNDWIAIKNADCDALPIHVPPKPKLSWMKRVKSIMTRKTNQSSMHYSSDDSMYQSLWNLHRRIRDSLFAIYANDQPLTDFGAGQYWRKHSRSTPVHWYDLTNNYDLTQDHQFRQKTDVLFCLNCIHFFSGPQTIDTFIRNIIRATTNHARIVLTYMHDSSNCTYFDNHSRIQFSVVRIGIENSVSSQMTVYIHPRRQYCTENIIELYTLMTAFNRYGIELVTRQTYPEFVNSAEFKRANKHVHTSHLHPITHRYSVLVLQRTIDTIGMDHLLTPKVHRLLHNNQLDVSFFTPRDLMRWCLTCKTIFQFNMYRKCLHFIGTWNFYRNELPDTKVKLTRLTQWYGVEFHVKSRIDDHPYNADNDLLWEYDSHDGY